ncbi:MAG TPA: tetratricopeptide repeat protein [Candidatus Binataceae bacterium]|nr:tetratricopeptide repeat protein [Candidatus Binataceae bacterium]
MRFCSQCGAPVIAGARFCVECGEKIEAAEGVSAPETPAAVTPPLTTTAARSRETSAPASPPTSQALVPFAAIFGVILAVGILVAFIVMRQLPRREALLTSAPSPVPEQPQAQSGQQLPPGHPAIQIPKEARDFIANLERKTQANPRDIATWDKYADVCLRAATLDASYYPKASAAYAHVLKLDPENLDALRGIGNIDFDQRKYDEAVAAYEHYLARKPDDPDVRTDLGTMLLSSGSADQAVLQYRKVLEKHPDFFEANFNLGIAYGQMNQLDAARDAFEKAGKQAPDAEAKNRVTRMLAEISNGEQGASATAQPPAQTVAGSSSANGFQGAMERMLRDLPIAGPKVSSVQWNSATKARVLMDNFPMDQMPPFAAAKFMSDLKAGIGEVKSAHQISAPVQLDICDAASGRVMKSVTE